jgi:hypothetical protein
VLTDTEDGDVGDNLDGDEGSGANLRNKCGVGRHVVSARERSLEFGV